MKLLFVKKNFPRDISLNTVGCSCVRCELWKKGKKRKDISGYLRLSLFMHYACALSAFIVEGLGPGCVFINLLHKSYINVCMPCTYNVHLFLEASCLTGCVLLCVDCCYTVPHCNCYLFCCSSLQQNYKGST